MIANGVFYNSARLTARLFCNKIVMNWIPSKGGIAMNHARRTISVKSASTLLLALMMLFSPLMGLAQPAQGPLTVTAAWTGADGTAKTATAFPVPYAGYENAYWLHLPEEAIQMDAALSILDNTGMYPGGFTIPQGQPVSMLGYIDAGIALIDTPVLFQGLDANHAPLQDFRLFISSMADTPEAPQPTAASPVSVPVHYVNAADGTPLLNDTALSILPGESAVATAAPIDGFTPDMSEQTVTVDANGLATPGEVFFRYSANATPEPQPVSVSVYYINDADEMPLLPETTLTVARGQSAVATAAPVEGFEPVAAEQTVTVDENGIATPNPVTFRYRAVVSQPVNINIHYVDENQAPVASSQVFAANDGTNTIKAAPTDLQEGYRLKDGAADTQYVIVSNNAADKTDVYFEYTNAPLPAESQEPETTEAPAPKVAIVSVYYRDQFGKPLADKPEPDSVTCVEGEENVIAVDLTKVDSNIYEFAGTSPQTVMVDANGVATPGEVVFLFRDLSEGRKASLPVHAMDENSQELFAETREIGVGEHAVDAPAAPEGYELTSAAQQTVTLGRDGTLTPSELFFAYAKKQTPTPAEPTPFPYTITAADEYAFPRSNTINFRSSPDADNKDNVLSVVGEKDLMHIEGSLINSKDEVWYYGTINGVQGFIKESVTRKITTEEAYKALGYTPIPPAAQTPTASPMADGIPINRWGVTVKNSNFRKTASTKGGLIDTLPRDAKVFVYQQQTGDNEKWYAVIYKNKEGFIMADLINLLSAEESDKIQASLSSPVPGRTLPPMAEETPPPAVETSTVSPATSSPSPEIYTGYALTTRPVQLRTGIGGQNEFVLANLPQNALVWVSAQVYQAGQSWSLVEEQAEKQSGYVEDHALRRISQQEAQPYLNALIPTAAPPILQQVTGYAITLGNNVPMRTYFSTNAQYTYNLGLGEVVQVLGQESGDGHVWHVVGYKGTYGFIRADQLRMMSAAEEAAYEASVRVAPLPVQPTIQPLTPSSLSSYGYVNADKVRLRKEADANSAYIKMMDKNAFALVLGTLTGKDNKTWYHINHAGTDGYVMGSYFTILPMNQLAAFLRSPEYLNANTSGTGSAGSGQITPVEDFNTEVWKNPSLAQASYEPFNPLGTATPAVEAILTPTIEPSASPEPTISVSPLTTETPAAKSSSFPTGLLAIGLLSVLGGGGYYAYYMYKQNQQRAAERSAKRRQMMQDQQTHTPQQRAAQPQSTSSFQPPRPVNPQQPAQGAATFKPQQQAQGTAPFRPQQPVQGTTPYQPQRQAQGTTPFKPAAPSESSPFRPSAPGAQATQRATPVQPQQTAAFRPQPPAAPTSPQQTGTPVAGAKAPQQTQVVRPLQQGAASAQPPQENASSDTTVRRRRSDRHDGEA